MIALLTILLGLHLGSAWAEPAMAGVPADAVTESDKVAKKLERRRQLLRSRLEAADQPRPGRRPIFRIDWFRDENGDGIGDGHTLRPQSRRESMERLRQRRRDSVRPGDRHQKVGRRGRQARPEPGR